MRLTRTIPAMLLLAVALAPFASAHDHVMVGEYELTIGWQTEPPVVDQPNAVWLKVMGPAPKLDSGMMNPGDTYQYTFLEAGTFRYHCHPHPWMQGNVTVVKPHHAVDPKMVHVEILDDASDPTGYRYSPENITINVGDTIHWMYGANATMMHTVTAMSGDHAEHHGDMGTSTEHGHGDSAMGDGHGGMGHGDSAGHGEHKSPAHAVEGADANLTVKVSIGGKERAFKLSPVHGEPGVYVARFIPTVAGTYTAHFTGTINGEKVDVKRDLQRVESLGDAQFPEKTDSLYDLQKKVDAQASEIAALKAKANAQADTPAKVTEKSNTPGFGLIALIGVGVLAAAMMRRKE